LRVDPESQNDADPELSELAEAHQVGVEAVKPQVFTAQPTLDLREGYLLSASYDGDRRAACLRLYEPETGRIHFWYDSSGHLPYCLSDLSPEELQRNTQLTKHPGFERIEAVKKYDPLQARNVSMSKIVAKDPLSIGGRPGAIREIIPKAWEADIRYYD